MHATTFLLVLSNLFLHFNQSTYGLSTRRHVYRPQRSLSITSHTRASEVSNDNSLGKESESFDVRWNPFTTPSPSDDLMEWKEVVSTEVPTGDSSAVLWKDYSIVGLTATGTALLFALLISASGAGGWRFYLAGGLCAAVSHTIPVPIDVVKTRKQVDPQLASKGFFASTRCLIKNEGFASLWAGLGPTAFGYLIEGAIKFGIYEACKPIIRKGLASAARVSASLAFLDSLVLSLMLSGVASGVMASIFLCPMEALRIRMVAQHDKNTNWVQAGMAMLRNEGISSLSRGMVPMWYKQIPYTVTKNGSFDIMTRAAYGVLRNSGTAISPVMKAGIPVLAGVVSSVLSCIASQPGDMVLSLMNANEGERRRTREIVRDIIRSERGVGGFFVGMKTRLLHVGVIVTLQLVLYDIMKQVCGIAATGST